jgi:GTP-binding protein Era
VYSDTPGVLKPQYKLQESMLRNSHAALEDADVLLYVTDVYETVDKNEEFLVKVQAFEGNVILIINKIDKTTQEILEQQVEKWRERLPNAAILPASALMGFNMEPLLKRIIELLPVSPPYFEKDALTDKTERFFVSEIIREKILLFYKKEIPYSVEVEIEEFKDEEKIIRIMAVIHVIRDSQRAIIIGHKGEALKRVGTQARLDMEAFFGKKVFLQLYAKVNKDWRDRDGSLKQFGYLD